MTETAVAANTTDTPADVHVGPKTLSSLKFFANPSAAEKLLGSCPEYQDHLFVVWKAACEWPADMHELSFPGKIMQALEGHKESFTNQLPPRVTIVEGTHDDLEDGDILVFPGRLHFRVPVDSADQGEYIVGLLRYLRSEQRWKDAEAKGMGASGLKATHVFVDCHRAYSEKDGVLGQQVHDAITRTLYPPKFVVHRCSHLGGSKFAATAIVCAPAGSETGPRVDWYGGLEPSNADAFAQAILSGEVPSAQWRGRMSLTRDEMIELASSLEMASFMDVFSVPTAGKKPAAGEVASRVVRHDVAVGRNSILTEQPQTVGGAGADNPVASAVRSVPVKSGVGVSEPQNHQQQQVSSPLSMTQYMQQQQVAAPPVGMTPQQPPMPPTFTGNYGQPMRGGTLPTSLYPAGLPMFAPISHSYTGVPTSQAQQPVYGAPPLGMRFGGVAPMAPMGFGSYTGPTANMHMYSSAFHPGGYHNMTLPPGYAPVAAMPRGPAPPVQVHPSGQSGPPPIDRPTAGNTTHQL